MTGWFGGKRETLLLFAAILLVAIALRWLAFSLFDVLHPDEVLQYQERAFRMVSGRGIIPWETRYGLRNALIPDLLAGAMAAAFAFTGDHWVSVISARVLFAAVCLAAVPAAYWLGSLRSPTHGLVAMFVAAIWFESIIFGVHVLAESIALPFAVGGTAALLRARDRPDAALLAGFLLAMTVLLRLQYAVFVATLALLVARADWMTWRRLILGALPALAIGAITDLAAGIPPFSWAVKNLMMNTAGGRADSFGVQGPLWYGKWMLVQLGPIAVPAWIAAILVGPRYRPVLIAAVVTIVAHSFIGHKEYRFIWLPVFLVLMLAAIAAVDFVQHIRSPRGRAWAIAGLCLLWSAASLWAYRQGEERTLLQGTARGGAPIVRAAVAADAMPGTCGIALNADDRGAIGQVFMPRPVELYLFPEDMDTGKRGFDPMLIASANALIVTRGAKPPPPYHTISCRRDKQRDICIYRREGGCDPAAARPYSYQAQLLANDL